MELAWRQMRQRLRAVITLALFLLGLTLVVGLGSGWADAWLVAAAWGVFAVLSALKIWAMWMGRGDATMSQASVLPRSWRRWIADEPRRPGDSRH